MDYSNGYENIAQLFIEGRGRAINGVGTSSVRQWAKKLSPGSTVLDLGCGTGIPSSKIFIDAGFTVYGIDASPSMVRAFQQHFPNVPVACEPAESSPFFNRQFDAIIAWGLLFLLPSGEAQASIIQKAANALQPGGKFLFTAPPMELEWEDAMTGQLSRSLGAERYKELLSAAGFSLIGGFEDEGGNYYFDTVRV